MTSFIKPPSTAPTKIINVNDIAFKLIKKDIVDQFDLLPDIQSEKFYVLKGNVRIPYECQVFKPSSSLKQTLSIKEFLETSYSKAGYSGFSFRYDTQYDLHSICISIINQLNQKISAVLRCTIRTEKLSIPFEDGLMHHVPEIASNDDPTSTEHVADINSFIYRDPKVLEFLFKRTARLLEELHVARAFCLYDISSKRYGALYHGAGFAKSKKFPNVSFSGFLDKNKQPVTWQIMELTREVYTQKWLS